MNSFMEHRTKFDRFNPAIFPVKALPYEISQHDVFFLQNQESFFEHIEV